MKWSLLSTSVSGQGLSTGLVQDLAEEGNSMGVKMGSLVQVNTALTSAHGWAKAAAAASAPSTANAPYSRRPHLAQVTLQQDLAHLPSSIL